MKPWCKTWHTHWTRVPWREEVRVVNDDGVIDRVFGLSTDVRYVAFGQGQAITMRERPGISEASAAESDRYEELLVNPTLLLLARQRGEIDAGGLEYLVIRYGRFFQLVMPAGDGHISVALEPGSNPIELASKIATLVRCLVFLLNEGREPTEVDSPLLRAALMQRTGAAEKLLNGSVRPSRVCPRRRQGRRSGLTAARPGR